MSIPVYDNFEKIIVLQIGTGGTGGWLFPQTIKFFDNINTRCSKQIDYIIIDHDIIEERNIKRQNFYHSDIGTLKVKTLTLRHLIDTYSKVIALPINFIESKNQIRTIIKSNIDLLIQNKLLLIVLGCVDNIPTRFNILNFIKKQKKKYDKLEYVYIDGGNDLEHGQIITIWSKQLINIFEYINRGYVNFKKFFKNIKEDDNPDEGCAFFGDQSQSINNLTASIMFCHIQNIFINKKLPASLIKFNINGYSTYKL